MLCSYGFQMTIHQIHQLFGSSPQFSTQMVYSSDVIICSFYRRDDLFGYYQGEVVSNQYSKYGTNINTGAICGLVVINRVY